MQLRIVLAFLALSLIAHASLFVREHTHESVKHSRLARRAAANSNSNVSPPKRCKPRTQPSLASTTHSTKATVQPTKAKATSTSVHHATASSSAPKPPSSGSTSSSTKSPVSGLLQVTSPVCGPSGATKEITVDSGPNGNEHFLNCGIDGSGWQPPHVTVDQLVIVDLDAALQNPKTPFKPCIPYISLFKKYGETHDLPPTLLASIAMQESTCNPSAVGGAGEQGLMQITKDKCGGAPGGNCQDPDFNIRTGAEFFATTLENAGGNVLVALGHYNGWTLKMTIAEATAAAHTSCCKCQNNLDYLTTALNGWFQDIDPRTMKMGVYQNLANC